MLPPTRPTPGPLNASGLRAFMIVLLTSLVHSLARLEDLIEWGGSWENICHSAQPSDCLGRNGSSFVSFRRIKARLPNNHKSRSLFGLAGRLATAGGVDGNGKGKGALLLIWCVVWRLRTALGNTLKK